MGARDKMLSAVVLGFIEKERAQSRCYLSTIQRDVVWLNQGTCETGHWGSGKFGETI